jgi:PilZ domain
MEEMPDRRKIKRRYLMYYSRVYVAENLIGHLVDITPQGAMLISEKPVETDKIVKLRMELSADVTDRPFMEFIAKSLWCRPDIDPNFYNTGFELLGVSQSEIEIIEKIVEAYGFRDN